MVDNVLVDPGTTIPIATRDLGGVQHQVVVPRGAALADGSGTITSGGTSQTVFAANTSRTYLLVQNISDTAMYVNFGGVATAGAGSFLLPASGGSLVMDSAFVSTESVTIFCATTGKAFTAKQA